MEKLIKQFLSINGDGDGYGYGDGDGYGNGYGNGNGDGYGYGDGYGNGDGYGDGDGYGYGDGDGYGYGYGDGDGNGDGDGDGYGYGDGDGYGYGDGDGDGDGDGYGDGDGIKLSSYLGNKVYYIDTIPGVFKSIKGNIALMDCINLSDFSVHPMYIVKKGNVFAHGDSIKEANEAVDVKYYSSIDKDTAIAEFKKEFTPGTLYPNSNFYKWHTILTGSCNAGKDLFMKQAGLSIDGMLSVDEFLKITENAYGGDIIRLIQY